MQYGEIQRELLKETRTPKRELEAINVDMSIQNRLKTSRSLAHTVPNSNFNPSNNIIKKPGNNTRTNTNNFKPTLYANCGYVWSAVNQQNCPARKKTCKNSHINNYFAKFCRKTKEPYEIQT